MTEKEEQNRQTRAQVLAEVMQGDALAPGLLPPRSDEKQPIHYSELPEDADGPIAVEWNFYRREVGRLLAEGHEGRWVLIKGEEIIGIWDTRQQTREVAQQRYLMQSVLLRQILAWEPLLRLSPRVSQCLS